MVWRNDPDKGAVPNVGDGAVDIGRRTNVGQAVTYDGTDPDALIAFLGADNIRNIGGELYQVTSEGVMTPMAKLSLPAIVVRPPAGDWFTLTEAQLTQEYAIHVNVPIKPSIQMTTGGAGATVVTNGTAVTAAGSTSPNTPKVAAVKKAAAKKAPAKKAAAKK